MTAPQHPTLAELRRSGVVAATEIVAATTAYAHDPQGGRNYRFASGYVLDVAAAVRAHPASAAALIEPTANEKTRRLAISTAIMLAQPTRGPSMPTHR